MGELILKEDALNCFRDWIDRYGYEHTADEDTTYQLIEALDAVRCCDEDCISRRVVIEAIDDIESEVADDFGFQYEKWRKYFCELPAVQPDHTADIGKKVSISCGHENDLISRQAAIAHAVPLNLFGREVMMVSVSELENLPSAQPEPCEDTVSRQRLLSDLKELVAAWKKYPVMAEQIKGVEAAIGYVEAIPSAQPERTCVNCGRTANNGGWYADGRTRCPIEEHYALPKDGFCHLWEKRNVTDDDYPERRTDGRD